MIRGLEYQPKPIPVSVTVPPVDWSVSDSNPLPADVQYALRHGKTSDEVHDFVAAEIDKRLADGGAAEYLGSVRRLYIMYGKVPSIPIITEELNYLHGVPFPEYARRQNEYTVPITEDAVSAWKQKRDQIIEILLGYGTRWVPWYFKNISDYLTEKELKIFAEETVFKIVTFNWDLSDQSRTGRTRGADIIHLVTASMKKMLFHYEFRKIRLQDHEFLYDDQRPSLDGEPMDVEDTYLVSEEGIPEPERPISGTPRLLHSPFRMDESMDDSVDKPYASAKDLQKIPLSMIFSIMRTLSSSDQYLLFSYFGYINQGLRQPEICAKVNVSTPAMNRAWHRLHSAILQRNNLDSKVPDGNLHDWITSLDPSLIAQRRFAEKADKYALFHILDIVQKIGKDEVYARLDVEMQEVMSVILSNLTYNENGFANVKLNQIQDAVSKKFGFTISRKDMYVLMRDILIPQLENGVSNVHTCSLREYILNKKARRPEQRTRNIFDGKSFSDLELEVQKKLLMDIKKEKRQSVIILTEGMDRGGIPRTYQEVADLMGGISREAIRQQLVIAYTQMAKSYSSGGLP